MFVEGYRAVVSVLWSVPSFSFVVFVGGGGGGGGEMVVDCTSILR